MKHLLLICMGLILFSSCISIKTAKKRAYDYMLTDTFRDQAERAKLSRGYFSEFPFYKDTPTVKVTVDSSAYNDYVYNTKLLLDQLIQSQYLIDSLEALPRFDSSGKQLPPPPPKCRLSRGDSAAIFQAWFNKYPPPPINKNTEKETPIKTDGKLAEVEKALSECSAENAQAVADKEKAEQAAKDKKKTNTYLWILVAVLAAGHAWSILNKLK